MDLEVVKERVKELVIENNLKAHAVMVSENILNQWETMVDGIVEFNASALTKEIGEDRVNDFVLDCCNIVDATMCAIVG